MPFGGNRCDPSGAVTRFEAPPASSVRRKPARLPGVLTPLRRDPVNTSSRPGMAISSTTMR